MLQVVHPLSQLAAPICSHLIPPLPPPSPPCLTRDVCVCAVLFCSQPDGHTEICPHLEEDEEAAGERGRGGDGGRTGGGNGRGMEYREGEGEGGRERERQEREGEESGGKEGIGRGRR